MISKGLSTLSDDKIFEQLNNSSFALNLFYIIPSMQNLQQNICFMAKSILLYIVYDCTLVAFLRLEVVNLFFYFFKYWFTWHISNSAT